MRIAGTASALAAAALLALPSLAHASPQFTQMNVALYTLDKGVGADTRVEISIVPDDGGAAVAYADLQGQDFPDNHTVQEVVPSAGAGFTLDDLKHEQIQVKITQRRFSAWHFGFDVVLHFDDGSEALLGSGKLTVSGGYPMAVVPLAEATIAHQGLFGGMAKMGFKLLSKDTGTGAPRSAAEEDAQAPRRAAKEFTHMDIAFSTGPRGKDAGTRLEVSIEPDGGGPAVAYLDVQGQEFPANGSVSLAVPSSGAGFTLADMKHERIVVKVTPSGHGTWTSKFDAILHFADGSQALMGSGDLVLYAESDHETVSLADAPVAHPSFFGKVEKLGFRMLSHGSVAQTEEPPGAMAAGAPAQGAAHASRAPKRHLAANAFTRMEVKLRSGDRGKAASTRVEISIVRRGGGPALAYLDLEDREIRPNSSMEAVVLPTDEPFTSADLKDTQILVKITPVGHALWTNGLDVTVRFADGSAALWSTGDLTLSDYASEESIPLSQATVASKGLFGGVEKLGFGLLNTIGK